MTKLNDARRQLLEAAATNEDGFIDIAKAGKTTARALIKEGLLIATPQDGAEGRCLITIEGRAAVAPAGKGAAAKKTKAVPAAVAEPTPAPAKLNKTELMVQLLTRPQGASIVAMSEATGWLPHSVRGFMAGTLKKKLGMTVTSEIVEGLRIYRATKG
ncbi:MAG: DUF3489 domain-containing protein [Caulobacterales bacterium]|nr:DUF3489 domain-containing protein [Caulobacterales bacterium]